ncbi:MAG: stage II sporulation protein M [Candidatus Syntrophoarchaeum sp. WYZ-LMO15]|nr:MAG: stage II sporulation protein M [Candidatus Syntrophoarchaeum sp. WYZ-LMO15]
MYLQRRKVLIRAWPRRGNNGPIVRGDLVNLGDVRRYFCFSTLILFVSIITGYIYGLLFPECLEGAFSGWEPLFEWVKGAGHLELFLLIFLNNTIKSFIIMVLGLGLGVIPGVFLIYNGLYIGLAVYLMKGVAGWKGVVLGIMPHGIIEIPAVLLAAGVGMRLGDILLQTLLMRGQFDIRSEFKGAVSIFFRLILPMLFIAALIEAFVTSQLVGGM